MSALGYDRTTSFARAVPCVLALLAALASCRDEPRERPPAPAVTQPAAPEPPRALSLCAGRDHTCALMSDAGVACWGDNLDHQSAGDDRPAIDAPTLVRLPPAVAVHCGPAETCARTEGGELHCIGAGLRGVERVPLASPATDAVLHARGGCALSRDGAVSCWTREPGQARAGTLQRAASGATALGLHPTDADRVCAVAASGLARCFRTSAIPDVVTIEPSRVAAPPRASSRASGAAHACEIGDGAVRCSGRGSSGQLGDGRPDRHAEPVEVAGVEDAVQLDGRDGRVCALLSSGRVLCWGRAPRSERPAPSLGRPVTVGVDDPDFVPRALDLPEPVLEVRANGDGPTCVRTAGGWSCLYDRWRRDGSVGGTRHTWLDEVGAPPMRHVAADGTCGASRDGRLICASGLVAGDEAWGLSSWIAMRAEARFVGASSAFARGEHGHACGRTEDGRVRCFRLPAHGEPVAVRSPSLDALAGVVHLEAASSGDDALACALTAQGTVHCFGDHRFGQLGPARLAADHDAFTAVRVEGLPPAVEIVVGATHACARTSGGRVWCWGDDREGTAPDGSSPESAEPVRVVWPPREDSAH